MEDKFLPNSFQVPNALVDDIICILSPNALKCYLIIVRKTVGWQKEWDKISTSQLMALSGIKRKDTIYKAIAELEDLELIESFKSLGKLTEYRLVLKNRTSTNLVQKPVLKNRTSTGTKKPYPTKDTIKTKQKTPTKDEILAYIEEKDYQVDGNYFYEYFTISNWIDSKGNKVKNWKQKLMTWNKFAKVDDKKEVNFIPSSTYGNKNIDLSQYE